MSHATTTTIAMTGKISAGSQIAGDIEFVLFAFASLSRVLCPRGFLPEQDRVVYLNMMSF